MTDPAKHYEDLPEHVREFFQGLSKDDVLMMGEGIRIAKTTRTMGKFTKWAFILAVTAFAGMATIGQSIDYIMQRIRGS